MSVSRAHLQRTVWRPPAAKVSLKCHPNVSIQYEKRNKKTHTGIKDQRNKKGVLRRRKKVNFQGFNERHQKLQGLEIKPHLIMLSYATGSRGEGPWAMSSWLTTKVIGWE